MKNEFVLWWISAKSPRKVAEIFEAWAKDNGYRKLDRRREDNGLTFAVHGKDSGWHKCELSLTDYAGNPQLLIVLRKTAGDYLIVGKGNGERALEVDRLEDPYRTVEFVPEKLEELVHRFPMLFKALGVQI